jgi:hypothetical protein
LQLLPEFRQAHSVNRSGHELTAENGYPDRSEAKNREMDALQEKFGLVFPENSFDERSEIMTKFGLK